MHYNDYNDTLFNSEEDVDLLIKLNGAKVKLNSIEELKTLAASIHGLMAGKTLPVLRAWVYKLKAIHPELDSFLNDFTFFKSISEEVGSRTLTYSKDTPSLELEDWSSDEPKPIRKIVKQKLDSGIVGMVENSYQQLNTRAVINTSTEFAEERERRYSEDIYSKAHDFHIAGDISYWDKNLEPSQDEIKASVISYLQGAEALVNHLSPVVMTISVNEEYITIYVEGKDISIEPKGDKYTEIAKSVDNTVLTPKEING